MPPSQDISAVKVLALLKSARLVRDDEALHQAAEMAKLIAPGRLSDLTPRFEAYFAIVTLIASLRHKEDRDSIERRFAHAISQTTVWIQKSVGATITP